MTNTLTPIEYIASLEARCDDLVLERDDLALELDRADAERATYREMYLGALAEVARLLRETDRLSARLGEMRDAARAVAPCDQVSV